jgi:hypothetical protein
MSLSYPWHTRDTWLRAAGGTRSVTPGMTSTYAVMRCRTGQSARCVSWHEAVVATGLADMCEPAEQRMLRNGEIFVQFLADPLLCVYDSVMSGAPKAARTRA